VTDASVALAVVPLSEVEASVFVSSVDCGVIGDVLVAPPAPTGRVEVPDADGVAGSPARSVFTVPSGAVYSPVL